MRHRGAGVCGLLGLCLSGCGQAWEVPGYPALSRLHLPTVQAIRDYHPLGGVSAHRECLGRLVFDAPQDMEWALSRRVDDMREAMQFPDGVPGDRKEGFRYEQLDFQISNDPGSLEDLRQRREEFVEVRQNSIRNAHARIAEYEAALEEARSSNDERSRLRAGQIPLKINESKAYIARLEADTIIDLGLPDSFVYQDQAKVYHLYLYRLGRVFYFEVHGQGEAQKQDSAWLRELMSRFRTREIGEIPTEQGVCFPYAFFADDGTGDYHAKATLRYPDRPGVVYTIDTGLVVSTEASPGGAGVARRPEPAALWVLALTMSGAAGGPLTAGQKSERIGLRGVKVGPIGADQGGISINTADEGEPEVMSYSIYTGNDGVNGLQVWPFIAVEMQSFTPGQTRDLTQNPPPLSESRERLDKLLRNLYLRPTTPPMPEFARLLPSSAASR